MPEVPTDAPPSGLLVSQSIWNHIVGDHEPLVYSMRREFGESEASVFSWDDRGIELLSLRTPEESSAILPAPAMAYLRAHGWGRETVHMIEDMMNSGPNRTSLALWLAGCGMVLTEADYLASLIIS